jgi:hypothetical protein
MIDYPVIKAIQHLEAFSADVIASLTLAQNYDLKRVAYDIELLLRTMEQVSDDLD